MTDALAPYEKWPVAALFVASGLYIAEWYAGSRLAIPADWMALIATLGGVAAMVAVDGAMIATVAGMRQGRRGMWSVAAILITALFGGLVALVLHGALPERVGAWLHAGFVATIAAYLLHLAQPRRTEAAHAAASATGATHITQAVQVNIALPATVAAYIAARAAELPDHSQAALAAELGVSADTVRRALKTTEVDA